MAICYWSLAIGFGLLDADPQNSTGHPKLIAQCKRIIGITEENLFYFYGHHRDIVMRFFGLDELIQPQVDAFDDLFGGKMRTFFQG